MSAIILALGFVKSAALGFYNINNIKRRVFQTRERFGKIELAIQNYVLKNGRFPCPSVLNCNENGCGNSSDRFGFEKRDSNGNCIYGNLNSAIFKSTNKDSEVILYGAVPFITLGIANNYSVDAWGNKIVYMIPSSLVKDNAFKAMISQKNNSNITEYLKDGLAYILMSFGRNRQGAFPYNSANSNYFSGNENMPINDFKVNEDNKKYLYFAKDFMVFEITGLEGELQECEELFIGNAFTDVSDSGNECINFNYTGSVQTFTVPEGVSELKLELWGAQGGTSMNSVGGKGGYAYGNLLVSNGTVLYIYIGGAGKTQNSTSNLNVIGGFNGGGNSGTPSASSSTGYFSESSGGGATDIRLNGTTLGSRIIVAGGGGGAGNCMPCCGYGNGGAGGGGGYVGGNATYNIGSSSYSASGLGGTLTSGGSSVCMPSTSKCSNSGALFYGGSGGAGNSHCAGGGGGGGYYGGGGGAFANGGGGGSGYIGGVVDGGGTSGINSGNGKATICYDGGSTSSRSLTFPKAKFGEISFSKEICPRNVSYPAKSGDYYYMSSYKDSNGIIIDNRAAKRCGRSGKWESGYAYECIKMAKCSKPSTVSSYSSKDWSDFNFEIVNTGVVFDKAHTVEMKCIINNSSGARWYNVN